VRIEQLRQEFELDVRWTLFPLHPDTPQEGMRLADLFAGQMDIDAVLARLCRVASEIGLPFSARTHTYNSRNAQELGKWADEAGQGEAFHQAVYRAYFVDGENIAQPEVLAAIVDKLELDSGKALQILQDHQYAEAVNADWQRAGELGVTAVPTIVFADKKLVGFQPYESFRTFILNG